MKDDFCTRILIDSEYVDGPERVTVLLAVIKVGPDFSCEFWGNVVYAT